MKIQCPKCRREYDVDFSFLDREVECTNCHNVFNVSLSTIVPDSEQAKAKTQGGIVPSAPAGMPPHMPSDPSPTGPSGPASSGPSTPASSGPSYRLASQTSANSQDPANSQVPANQANENQVSAPSAGGRGSSNVVFKLLAVLLVVALLGGGAYSCFFGTNKCRAIRNIMKLYKINLGEEYVLVEKSTVKKAWRNHALQLYEAAEKDKMEGSFIRFWCDGKISRLFKVIEMSDRLNKEDKPSKEDRKNLKREFNELARYFEPTYPQSDSFLKAVGIKLNGKQVDVNKQLIKAGYVRHVWMIELAKDNKSLKNADLRSQAEGVLAEALYNYSSDSSSIKNRRKEIEKLCDKEASRIIEAIEEINKDWARDWMRLVISKTFEEQVKKSRQDYGTTKKAFDWLVEQEGIMLPELGVKWQLISFEGKYKGGGSSHSSKDDDDDDE